MISKVRINVLLFIINKYNDPNKIYSPIHFSLFKKIRVSFRKIQFIKRGMEKKRKKENFLALSSSQEFKIKMKNVAAYLD